MDKVEFPELPPTERLKKAADVLRVESAFLRIDSRSMNPDAALVLQHAAKKIFSVANSVEKLTAVVWDE